MGSLRPAHALALGYFIYIFLGAFALALPLSQDNPASWLDHLFISASAVSTTGLTTVDPGRTYSFLGELILLLLIQVGGLGYMTTTSFLILAAHKKLSESRVAVLKSVFSLPKTIGLTHFVRDLIVFTLICEALGAAILYGLFFNQGVENALWSAVFHSVSAFCTAGFSLFPTSFEGFRENWTLNLVIATLSYAGGVGFIVWTDLWSKWKEPRRQLTFTTKVILSVTGLTSLFGSLVFFLLEPSIQSLEPGARALSSFFQVMTASTTVGFNTLPIGQLALPSVLLLSFLMFFGASPAGTGGGLKSTTLTALLAEAWSHLRGRQKVCLFGHEIPEARVRAASMSATSYALILSLGVFAMSLAMPTTDFKALLFEATSALGTVGLSLGITADLNAPAKMIVIFLMYVGRLGVISLGLSFVAPRLFEKSKPDDLAI